MTTASRAPVPKSGRWLWPLLFAILTLYVATRMGAFALTAAVPTPSGPLVLPNTFASVDHPFHVARAEMLWRELASGRLLRWVSQHQGGYPVDFYPLGEAWLEVVIRALSLATLSAHAAHTLAVIALFLLPGLAYGALARRDGWSPAVALIALVLHVSLPGSWYDGGYTELVQWGLGTNVAAAVAALLMLPALVRFLGSGSGWAGALAVSLAAMAIYSNPRSLLGLAALGGGAWLALTLRSRFPPSPAAVGEGGRGVRAVRLALSATITALLAAPALLALVRFGDLYTFVRYSDYDSLGAYAATAATAVTWPVLILALLALVFALISRERIASAAVAMALILYVLITVAIAFVPAAANLAPQLEPTRLMPLQRFLTIYLAAVAVWLVLSAILSRLKVKWTDACPLLATALAGAFLLIQTRPLAGIPDPAAATVPPVSLYPVATSAQPQQADLEAAVRAADAAAPPGTALLVIGSALSWHQQLWTPLWTARPLYYDNWLWYWHPDHAGTPGYAFLVGHHYPDPEATLQPDYLDRHGIGAVVVTGPARDTAARTPRLRPLRSGAYDTYTVADPVTTVTFDGQNAASTAFANQRIAADAEIPAVAIAVRANWHPRWEATSSGRDIPLTRTSGGSLTATASVPVSTIEFVYTLQPLDWAARALATLGLVGTAWLAIGEHPGWYHRRLSDAVSRRHGARTRG